MGGTTGFTSAPRPKNVYDPDQSVSPVTLALVGIAGIVVLALFGVAILRWREEPERPRNPFVPGGELVFERGVTELDDGWWAIDVDDGEVAAELPGPLLRTRADLAVGGFGDLPMAVWGGGEQGGAIYGLGVADLPGGWSDRRDELLATVPLPVQLEVFERERQPTTVGDLPATAVRADGPDGRLVAMLVVDDDRLVVLLAGDSGRGDPTEDLDRMVASLSVT